MNKDYMPKDQNVAEGGKKKKTSLWRRTNKKVKIELELDTVRLSFAMKTNKGLIYFFAPSPQEMIIT